MPLLKAINFETRDWIEPRALAEPELQAARRDLTRLERHYRTAARDWLSGRIVVLLSHYFTPDMSEALAVKAIGDWLNVLGGFSAPTIEEACQRYLRSEPRKRPTPGAVYELAELCAEPEWTMLQRLRRLAKCAVKRQSEESWTPPPVRTKAMIAWEAACVAASRDASEVGKNRLERLLSMRRAIEAGAPFVEPSDEVVA